MHTRLVIAHRQVAVAYRELSQATLEYVEGTTLSSVLRRREAALQLALAELHDAQAEVAASVDGGKLTGQ